MTAHHDSRTHPATAPASQEAGHGRATRRGYLVGFLLSAVLTAAPFWLAMTGVLPAQPTAVIVILLALVQIVVHTIFFLHVNTKAEGGWTLLALVFTAIMVVIVVLGSLWIMYHLHGNMMPTAPQPPPVV